MLDISGLFDKELRPALGCTEPAAIGYASSLAYNAILGRVPNWLKGRIPIKHAVGVQQEDIEVSRIEVSLDRGVFKNALAVGVPRSNGQKGIAIAAAMGMFCFPETQGKEMALFDGFRPEDLARAESLAQKVSIKLNPGWERSQDIRIEASVEVRQRQFPVRVLRGTATIEKAHSNVTSIDVYDSLGLVAELPFHNNSEAEEENPGVRHKLAGTNISEMVAELETLPEDVTQKMVEMMEMNIAISEEGLRGRKGLGIGAALRDLVNEKYLGDDVISSAQIMVASAADARMSGVDCPVMSCAGSGNQGITASLPIVAFAQRSGYDVKGLLRKKRSGEISREDEKSLSKLVKAVALSNMITCYVTYRTGYLSALCGCATRAGLGATAGVAYLLTESADKVEWAIQNMATSITGIICDGGKEGCSLKLIAITSVALQSALLASKGVHVPSDNGIVAGKVEDTIENIGRLCQAMLTTDAEITRIMLDKGTLAPP